MRSNAEADRRLTFHLQHIQHTVLNQICSLLLDESALIKDSGFLDLHSHDTTITVSTVSNAVTMVKYFDSISDDLKEWAMNQAIFFTASAPTYGKHVNLSPKGLPSTSFSVLSPNRKYPSANIAPKSTSYVARIICPHIRSTPYTSSKPDLPIH